MFIVTRKRNKTSSRPRLAFLFCVLEGRRAAMSFPLPFPLPLRPPLPPPKPLLKKLFFVGTTGAGGGVGGARVAFVPLRSPISLSSLSAAADAGLRFREKLLYLEHELGLNSAKALDLNPSVRSASLASLRAAAGSLESSYGLRPADAARILDMYPNLLTCDPDSQLLPVRDFLLGPAAIPLQDLPKAVTRCPRLIVSSVPGQLLPALRFLRHLGFVGRHRITWRTTVLLVSSLEATLVPKLDYLRGLGFSEREVRLMVLRSPCLLTFSIDNNFRPKVEFLIEEMGREIEELKDFPQYFACSLEGKIKPRHRLLAENRLYMSLSDMLTISDGEFKTRLFEMRLSCVEEVQVR